MRSDFIPARNKTQDVKSFLAKKPAAKQWLAEAELSKVLKNYVHVERLGKFAVKSSRSIKVELRVFGQGRNV